MLTGWWHLGKAAGIAWWEDRAMSLGAAIAFFTTFSLAPILLAAIAVAGLAFGREAAQGAMVSELGTLVGDQGAATIDKMIGSARDVGTGIVGTVVGAATFLLVSTGAIVELQDDLNIVWNAKAPPANGLLDFFRTRLLSIAFILGIGFVLLVSLIVDAGVSSLGNYLEDEFSGAAFLIGALNSAVAFGIAVLFFAMIFKILPAVDLTWRDVAIGAVVTALLFTMGKFVIGVYLGHSDIATGYGAASSIVTILLWVYYSSLILLFGAEFTKVFARSRGSHMGRTGSPETSASKECGGSPRLSPDWRRLD
jgi:membrane protein